MWKTPITLLSRIDWPLFILGTAFVFVAPIGAFIGTDAKNALGALWRTADADEVAYAASIRAAAVLQPRHAVTLATIDPAAASVDVVTLGARTPNTKEPVWVALPAQLRAACAGATNPVRRLQQVLGLPRRHGDDIRVHELRVKRDDLFRPCVNGGDLAQPHCSTDPPEALPQDADPTKLRAAYDRLHFSVSQLWRSHRVQFSNPGYPFTGMGWTYDWSNPGLSIGVTEFVVARGADIKVLNTHAAADFCKAP